MEKLIIIGIILLIVLIFFGTIISISNNIKRTLIKIDEANSGIDIALTKRFEILNKLVEVVKGYTKHEKEVLFEVVKLRNNMTTKEKIEQNDKMTTNHELINITAENYPNLKANEQFINLQKAILDVEEHLQAARRMYNSNVAIYNEYISVFPNSIIANIKKYKPKEFFSAKEEAKSNVKIEI